MADYFDTYFFDSKIAKKTAKQHNYLGDSKTKIQICYHPDLLTKENLIGVPIDNIKQYFLTTKYRFPTHIDFTNSTYANNDEEQEKVVNIFYTLFQEIQNEKNQYTLQLVDKYNNLKIKQGTSIGFIASKTQPHIVQYFKSLQKGLKNRFKTSFLTQQTAKDNMILEDISIDDVYKFIIKNKPNYLFFYNEFYPDFNHKDIKFVYIIDSFKICEKILEYRFTSNKINDNIIFFTTSHYYNKILNIKKIKATLLPSYFLQEYTKKIVYKKKKYDVLLVASYQDMDKYYIFNKMFKKIDKYLINNILYMKILISYISKAKYPIKKDWELNILLQQYCILKHIVKHTSLNLNILGSNWDKITKKHKIIKFNKNIEKLYQKTKYVITVSYKMDTNAILSVLQNGAIPVIYDLRADDKFYKKELEDYCLFFKNIQQLDKIIASNQMPKKQFDKDIYNLYSQANLQKVIIKEL